MLTDDIGGFVKPATAADKIIGICMGVYPTVVFDPEWRKQYDAELANARGE